MLRRLFLAALLSVFPIFCQKYTGPRPPKPDIAYLVHADNLLATEVSEAKEQDGKDALTYVIGGATSPARTPLASPIFLIKADKIDPTKLQLFKLESKDGQREIEFPKKKRKNAPRPVILTVTKVSSDNIYRVEVDETLDPGEYSLTPEGSNQVFCFQVF